jgi:tetraacyldisaccharide 4'-kinase
VLQHPVISIGNLAAGGRAKTPMAALVAAALRDAGERPAILSRGYARTNPQDGVVVVRDPDGIRGDVERSGDEPLMLARQLDGVAVLVSSARYLAGRLAETQFGCTVHVLDDGFQHFDLKRDADLVIVAQEDLDRPVTFPAGRLREPLDAAAAADAFIALDPLRLAPPFDSAQGGGPLAPFVHGKPAWHARRVIPAAPSDEPVLALAGTASPAGFFAGLRANGWNVAAELPFRDHHPYSEADLARIAGRMRAAGAARAVTTAKDYVRLLPFRPFPIAIDAVAMTLDIDDRASLVEWLLSVVRRARANPRAGHANGAGYGVPASEPAGGAGGAKPRGE